MSNLYHSKFDKFALFQGYEEEPEEEEKIEMGKQNDNNSMDIQNVNLEFETNETKELKDKLRKHFMGAIEKYLFFDRFPWNLCIQVIKLILITIQVSQIQYSFGVMLI